MSHVKLCSVQEIPVKILMCQMTMSQQTTNLCLIYIKLKVLSMCNIKLDCLLQGTIMAG